MISLSVVVITYNEEKNIGRCLESIKGVADDILIVDSFSIDKTKEICQSFGATFIQHIFDGYIEQKNYASGQASSDYILSLDADEALSEELRRSILGVKKNWGFDGYGMNRLTNYCGKWIRHGGWYPDRKIRLFDRRKGRWAGINPHDRFEISDSSANVQHLHGDILHYSYTSISGHIKQVDYFTEIAARTLFEKKERASLGRIVIAPVFRFIRDYFLKLGFLDGYFGFVISTISSHAVFVKYVKLRQLYNDYT